MRVGVSLFNNWGIEDVQSIVRLAIRAEELGFDSVWAHDHVFSAARVFDRLGGKPYYEPLTILSYVAAVTRRVGLGTSVLVLPYHNPMRLAKTAATLDVLSGGRLILGVGVGSIEQESNAMGSPFAERGAIADEAIAVMKELWTKEEPSFEGKYHRFSGMKFSPKPLQKPHIPLLIGGRSRPAIRRAARLGDGWHPLSLSPEELSQGIQYLREQAQAAGRDVSEIPLSVNLDLGVSRPGRYALGTDLVEILENAQAFASLGVQTMVISANTGDVKEIFAAIDMLARRVLPALR